MAAGPQYSPLLPVDYEDRDEGVARVYSRSLRFVNRRKLRLNFQVDKAAGRAAVANIWDKIGDIDFRHMIEGGVQQTIPDDYLRLLVYAVVKTQAEMFLADLPRLPPPDISSNGNS